MFSWFTTRPKTIYLDYAAATPVRREVLQAMAPYWSDHFGNPGAIHTKGVSARGAIEDVRATLARTLRIRAQDVLFTGSGTESNNLALLGAIEYRRKKGIPYTQMEVLTTAIEHASVIEVCNHLKSQGVKIVYMPLTEDGCIDVTLSESLITPQTVCVITSYVNSEIGVIQPLSKISRSVRKKEQEFKTSITLIADGAQAPLWLSCALDSLGVDILTLDAGKCYGPKGIGVIAKKHHVQIEPIFFGGDQELGLRPSTENTPLIIGAVHALVHAQTHYGERSRKVKQLREMFFEMLTRIEGVVINGSRTERVANNVHISVDGVESEFAVITLSEAGIFCATKSACGGAKGDGSSVVREVTGDDARARTTIRFTLGEDTHEDELRLAAHVLSKHIERTRLYNSHLTQK